MQKLVRLVLLILASVWSATVPAAAQVVSTPIPYVSGFKEGAIRIFATTNPDAEGTIYILVAHIEMGSAPVNDAKMTRLLDAGVIDELGHVLGTDLRRLFLGTEPQEIAPSEVINVPTIGDVTIGLAGRTVDNQYAIRSLFFSEKEHFFAVQVIAHNSDPLTDAIALAEVLAHRAEGNAVPTARGSYRNDGAFELLPKLSDMPIGFAFDREFLLVDGADNTDAALATPVSEE